MTSGIQLERCYMIHFINYYYFDEEIRTKIEYMTLIYDIKEIVIEDITFFNNISRDEY